MVHITAVRGGIQLNKFVTVRFFNDCKIGKWRRGGKPRLHRYYSALTLGSGFIRVQNRLKFYIRLVGSGLYVAALNGGSYYGANDVTCLGNRGGQRTVIGLGGDFIALLYGSQQFLGIVGGAGG